jgi:hypothetical protein
LVDLRGATAATWFARRQTRFKAGEALPAIVHNGLSIDTNVHSQHGPA